MAHYFHRVARLGIPVLISGKWYYAGGGPALKDLIGGQVQMMFEPMSASIGPIRAASLARLP